MKETFLKNYRIEGRRVPRNISIDNVLFIGKDRRIVPRRMNLLMNPMKIFDELWTTFLENLDMMQYSLTKPKAPYPRRTPRITAMLDE